MGLTPKLGVRGLYTNPNPLGAPDGALLEASEVVLRRPGMAEPRPGFKASASTSLASLYAILQYGSGGVFVGPAVSLGSTTYDGAGGTTAVYDGNQTSPAPAALQWYRDAIRATESRGNLYLTTKDTMRLLTSSSDAVAMSAGAVPPNLYEATLDTGGSFMPTGSTVSYRLVYKRVDANGLITLSAPSGQFILANTSGGDRGVSFTFSWRGRYGYRSTDAIQVYRSEVNADGLVPDDLHFLVAEIPINGTADTDGTSGSGTFVDRTTAEDETTSLGAALYINSTATDGGAAASNIRPPAPADLALYQGSVFWSGYTDYARQTVSWEATANLGSSAATGIGYRQRSGTRTNGSPVITGLSSVTGLKVGMILSSATNWDPAKVYPVRILSIVGSDLTMSHDWQGSTDGAPVTLTFVDSIVIGNPATGTSYYRADFANYTIEGVNRGQASPRGRCFMNATAFAYAIGASAAPATSRTYTVAFEAFSALDSFTISATHGSEYRPQLPEPSATPTTIAPAAVTNGVGWSDRDLPEHRRLASYARVGRTTSPVLRVLATKDALWVLKHRGDGVYRISGMGAETGFRIDQVDSSTYLLHPNLACALDDVVYAWTNKGLCSISDAGVVPISEPVIGADLRALETALDTVTGFEHASFAVANAKDGEVIFGMPDPSISPDTGAMTRIYVYNTRRGGICRWFVGSESTKTCAVYDQTTRLLGFGTSTSGALLVERSPSSTTVINADAEFSLTISSISGNVVTLSGAVSGWTPAVGDLVRQSSAYAIITAVTSSTVFTVNDASVLSAAAGTSYRAFTSRVAWDPVVEGAPAALKRFSEVIVHFEDSYGLRTFEVDVSSSRSATSVDTDRTITWARTHAPLDERTLVSRSHTMASRLYPAVEITQADSRWAMSGISFVSEPLSTRLHR